MTIKPSPRLALALAFGLQAILLSAIIANRALLLANGTEVRLAVQPVDPRDLFRGDYVVLSYALSRLETAQLAGDDDFSDGEPIYVSLEKAESGWAPVAVHHKKARDGLYLRGQINGSSQGAACTEPCQTLEVEYGLEQFFVPEGEGRALEELRNGERLEVDVAVSTSGQAVLKRLLVDGAVHYEDALF